MQPTILIVEDTEDDRLLAKIGLKAANLPFSFEFVCDGYEAMQYLERKEQYADRAIYSEPCVLITDLKMPRVDGFALLSWIRNNPIWTRLPVIVWSSSMLEEDQRAADVCGADAYVTKSMQGRVPADLVRAIRDCTAVAPKCSF